MEMTVGTDTSSVSEGDAGTETLLVESLSRWFGFEALAARLPVDVYPPYLFVATGILLDFGTNVYTQVFTDLTGGVFRNPFGLAIPAFLLLAVYGTRYMHEGQQEAYRRLARRDDVDDGKLKSVSVSLRGKVAVYVVLVATFYVYIVFGLGLESLFAEQGIAQGIVTNFVANPVVYAPVAIEFGLLYISAHVLLPRRVEQADVGLFFFDPRNMGGFKPVGELLKRSYYLYTGFLLLYLAFVYGPSVTGVGDQLTEPGLTEAAFFTGLWAIGLATLSYSIYKTHQIMAAEKERRYAEIEEEIRQVVDNPHDITDASIEDEEQFQEIERRLEQVRTTSEYPTTFTMWTQIGISVLLPQLLQLSVQAV